MVCHAIRGHLCGQVRRSSEHLVEGDGAGLRELLPPERVAAAVESEAVKFIDCLYTPLVTLWTFLGQVLGPDRSCAAAVARLLALLGARGAAGGLCDPEVPEVVETGPYCKARQRLPERLVSRLGRGAGAAVYGKEPPGRLLGGPPGEGGGGTTRRMAGTQGDPKGDPPAPP